MEIDNPIYVTQKRVCFKLSFQTQITESSSAEDVQETLQTLNLGGKY